ncbi:MAG: outer membrane lipoprotein LolB [Burkholderiaceae bacterium]|nr:outer membrane lipoprotein LolB [Burkholderiaceae bacterium]
MSRVLAALAGAAVLALAGCATPGAPGAASGAAGPPNFWAGRFAATVTEAGHDARQDRSSGHFALRIDGARTELELSSPLGQAIAQLQIDGERATLVAADGKTWEAPSAETLTEQVFGWRVPLADLPAWLEGRIAEPTEHDGARVIAGREHGWSVRIEAGEAGQPRRLALDWPAETRAGERRLSLRLVIDGTAHILARP